MKFLPYISRRQVYTYRSNPACDRRVGEFICLAEDTTEWGSEKLKKIVQKWDKQFTVKNNNSNNNAIDIFASPSAAS